MTSKTRTSFTLSGPSIELDARTLAVRGDLADIALAGKLFVPHYAQPMAMTCTDDATTIFATPDRESATVGGLERDTTFMVVDMAGGWAWGFRASDHIVGYVDMASLAQAK
jgi:hypothetical protein